MSANHIASKNLLGMPANSVAGIFMFTIIAFSFFNHGFCSMSHNPVSSKNMTTLQLTQNINTTISEMASMIDNNLSKNQQVDSPRVSLQVQENFNLMSDYLEALKKNLEIVKFNSLENEKTQSKIIASKSNELEALNQTHLNMELQLKNEIDLLKNTNEKLIQELNALKEINEKNLKVIENEYQLNLTNKQEVIKMLMIENSKKPSTLELDDLMETLLSIMEFNGDNVPNDLMEKRHTLFAKHYDEKMTVMVNERKRLFNDIAVTSSSQSTNKYVCNKKTTYYDSDICALLSQNADGSEIFMDRKNLTFLPRDIFTGLEKVNTLVLRNNHLTNLEPGVFDGLFECGMLDLNNNDLTTLSKDTFTSLKQLNGLWLHLNQLNKLESGTFDGLFGLTTINLSHNQLTYLPQDIFKDNNELRWLYLDYNKINTLSSETFSKLRLTDLSIHENCLNDSNIEILKKNIFVKHQFLY